MATLNSFILVFTLAEFGFHCLMAPAAAGGGTSRILEPATVFTYGYESTVLMNQVEPGGGKDVGFRIAGQLSLETVWQSARTPQDKLLQIKLLNPKLLIKSRKAPAPEGFVSHSSKLEDIQNGPFLLHWSNGHAQSVYINQNEAISTVNLKKGISSFFQFQIDDQETNETDSSGVCAVRYTVIDRTMIEKVKTGCDSIRELPFIKHPDQLWRAAVSSKRRSIIVLSSDLSAIESVDSEEKHELSVPLRQEAGGVVISQQRIDLQDRSPGTLLIQEDTIDAAVKNIEGRSGLSFAKHPLILTEESRMCSDGTCPSFFSIVKENREALKTENLGTTKSASAFIKLLNVAREAKKEDLIKTLKNSKNKNILLQLVDILGASQTADSHEAALKVIDFKSEESLDINERYLWSLSFGSHPLPHVIKDLIKKVNSGPFNEKLDETLVLTIAAMTNKLRKHNQGGNDGIEKEVLQILTSKLNGCSNSDDTCRLKYIRALKNLAAEDSVLTLLEYAKTGSKRVSVASINAVHSFPKSSWLPQVKVAARKMFFQLDKRYDSSARTLALDVLLKSDPDDSLLSELLVTLNNQDSAFEVKQYMMQRLNQIGESDHNLFSRVQTLIKSLNLTNYDALSQKGLSTAFTRHFMNHPSANGSLSTVQEMSGGIVKRGLVDVIIDKDHSSQSIFTLGLFAGGLSFILSSDESNSEETEEETATAGMDLMVMGVQLRPFVFFTGQGELMGHVWSGTASERTPAFQILSLLQDHLQYIPLQAGFISELNLQGGASFDLSGQIAVSLWNRNAESLVEKSAGLSVAGLIRVNTMFVHSQIQFNLGTEVNLRLLSNIDFSNNIALCLQLQQPNSIIKHNIHKVERIPGSKHRLRKSKYKIIQVPGRTYALNQKNNEMCNVIFTE